MLDKPSISELVQQYVSGDTSRQELLAEQLHSIAYQFVAQRLSNKAFRSDRDDVTQSLVIKLLGSLSRLRSHDELAIIGWIKTAAIRDCLNFYSAKKRESQKLSEAVFADISATLQAGSANAARQHEIELFIDWLEPELANLVRLILLDRNWTEIRSELGISRRQEASLRMALRRKYETWSGTRIEKQEKKDD